MKDVPANNKGLKKLPTEVRNKMGYKAKGGMAAKKKMESGGRAMSTTDASKAKSTPPKTGTDAQMQRMKNTVRSLAKDLNTAGIRSMFNAALKTAGSAASGRTVSDKDVSVARKAKKAYGGKTKMMAGGRAKKK